MPSLLSRIWACNLVLDLVRKSLKPDLSGWRLEMLEIARIGAAALVLCLHVFALTPLESLSTNQYAPAIPNPTGVSLSRLLFFLSSMHRETKELTP